MGRDSRDYLCVHWHADKSIGIDKSCILMLGYPSLNFPSPCKLSPPLLSNHSLGFEQNSISKKPKNYISPVHHILHPLELHGHGQYTRLSQINGGIFIIGNQIMLQFQCHCWISRAFKLRL